MLLENNNENGNHEDALQRIDKRPRYIRPTPSFFVCNQRKKNKRSRRVPYRKSIFPRRGVGVGERGRIQPGRFNSPRFSSSPVVPPQLATKRVHTAREYNKREYTARECCEKKSIKGGSSRISLSLLLPLSVSTPPPCARSLCTFIVSTCACLCVI